jgi:hypothetical protein
MQKGKIPKVEEYRNKFAVETHPVEVGIALDLFLFPAGPVPEVFWRLAVGATLEPASVVGFPGARGRWHCGPYGRERNDILHHLSFRIS